MLQEAGKLYQTLTSLSAVSRDMRAYILGLECEMYWKRLLQVTQLAGSAEH